MNTQHINNEQELSGIMQALPKDVKHLIIDAVGLPVGGYNYPETLTDYVHRIQERYVPKNVYNLIN